MTEAWRAPSGAARRGRRAAEPSGRCVWLLPLALLLLATYV